MQTEPINARDIRDGDVLLIGGDRVFVRWVSPFPVAGVELVKVCMVLPPTLTTPVVIVDPETGERRNIAIFDPFAPFSRVIVEAEPSACDHKPDDDPEPGDRCKYCGLPITWEGPGMYDWEVADGA